MDTQDNVNTGETTDAKGNEGELPANDESTPDSANSNGTGQSDVVIA